MSIKSSPAAWLCSFLPPPFPFCCPSLSSQHPHPLALTLCRYMPPPPPPLAEQGSQVEALQREVQELQGALATARAAADAAQAERDAYRMSAREIQDRSKVGGTAAPSLAAARSAARTLGLDSVAVCPVPASLPLPPPQTIYSRGCLADLPPGPPSFGKHARNASPRPRHSRVPPHVARSP